MSIKENIKLQITSKALSFARIYAFPIKNEFQRKRAFASISALYTLANLLEELNLNVDKSMTLFRNHILNEEYEIDDLYVNNNHLDIRLVKNEEVVLLPKIHFATGITPDLYVIIKTDSSLQEIEILGAINPNNVEFEEFNNMYYSVSLDNIISYDDFISQITEEKIIDFEESEHEFLRANYISLIDKEIDTTTKNKVLQHLFACLECRTEFCCFTGFETVSANMKNNPELIENNVLSTLPSTKPEIKQTQEQDTALPPKETEEELIKYKEEKISNILNELFNVDESLIYDDEEDNLSTTDTTQNKKPKEDEDNTIVIDSKDMLEDIPNMENTEDITLSINDEDSFLLEEDSIETGLEDSNIIENISAQEDFILEEDNSEDMKIIESEIEDELIVENEIPEDIIEEDKDIEEIPLTEIKLKNDNDIILLDEFDSENSPTNISEIKNIDDIEMQIIDTPSTYNNSDLIHIEEDSLIIEEDNIVENDDNQIKNDTDIKEPFIIDDNIIEETNDFINDIENINNETDTLSYENNQNYNNISNYDEEYEHKDDYNSYENMENETSTYEDKYEDENDWESNDYENPRSKNSTGALVFISLLIIIGLVGAGYYVFTNILPKNNSHISSDGSISLSTKSKKTTPKVNNNQPIDSNKIMSDIFAIDKDKITIRGIDWRCKTVLFVDKNFSAYLKNTDKNLMLNLKKNMAEATDIPTNSSVSAKIAIGNKDDLKKVILSEKSGSEQIDNIVLQSIKETFTGENPLRLTNSELKADIYFLEVVIKL